VRTVALGLALLGALAIGVASTRGAGSAYVTFRTPSGNIGCAYARLPGEPATLRCEIASGLRPRPRRPGSCHASWGRAVGMGKTGRAIPLCISDTVMDPHAPALAYGKTWRRDGFICESQTAGLTCQNQSNHGWFLSRARSRVF
jgi:hypothetical protein